MNTMQQRLSTAQLLLLSIALTGLVLAGCTLEEELNLPDYPILLSDTTYHFEVGDKFIISTSENSCCRYGWDSAGQLLKNLPIPASLTLDSIYYSPMDPDCAGCSSYSYYVFTCKAEDMLRLTHYVIPMGDDHAIADGDSSYWQENKEGYSRNYLIKIGHPKL